MRATKIFKLFGLPFAAALAFGACSVESADRGIDDTERGNPSGKADALSGSCLDGDADFCGGKSDGSCWCDEKCAEYGDCCEDVTNVCSGDQCIVGDDDTCPDDFWCQPGVCLHFCEVNDPDCCAPSTCVPVPGDDDDDDDDSDVCDAMDAHGQGLCEAFFGYAWNGISCVGLSGCSCLGEDCGETFFDFDECVAEHAECGADVCPPILCEPLCEFGQKLDGNGCNTCECNDPPDDGGSCVGNCGGAAEDKACYCDDLCSQYGDCCDDYEDVCFPQDCPPIAMPTEDICDEGEQLEPIESNGCVVGFECVGAGDREIAEGMCVKNSLAACETDADCMTGGCGGELCFNPADGPGFSTCECTAPTGPSGCGCVEGVCAWYND